MPAVADDLLWDVRAFVYERFADLTRPPALEEVAAHFAVTAAAMADIYAELDRRHAFFLEPGTTDIRIANPFSAVPTGFRVLANGRSYWANCAWDALGIPAALHADGTVEASCSGTGEPLPLAIRGGVLVSSPAGVAHFLVPFQRWYEDMAYT